MKTLLTLFLDRFHPLRVEPSEKGFAFLVHSRHLKDFKKYLPAAHLLPSGLMRYLLKHLWPVTVSKITGLKDRDGQEIPGWLIGIPMTGEQMLENRSRALQKIQQALWLAREKGAHIVGLGAFTSSITQGGLYFKDSSPVALTNGNAFTTLIALRDIEPLLEHYNQVGIIGAAGSIGSALAEKLVIHPRIQKLILVGRRLEQIERLLADLRKKGRSELNITGTTDPKELLETNLIVVATASTHYILRPEHVKDDTIIYDISEPSNVSGRAFALKTAVKIIKGGIVKTPGIDYHFNLGLGQNRTFACLAETMILAYHQHFVHFALGRVRPEHLVQIEKMGEDLPFVSIHSSSPTL